MEFYECNDCGGRFGIIEHTRDDVYCPYCKSDDIEFQSANPFIKYTDDLAVTLLSKNQAYGDSFTKSVDNFGKTVIAVRLSDKFNRICNLIKRGEDQENDESLEDTLLDMAGYSILALKYLKEHKNDW